MTPLGKWVDGVLLIYSTYITCLHLWSSQKLMKQLVDGWEKIRVLKEEVRKQKMLRRLGASWNEETEGGELE